MPWSWGSQSHGALICADNSNKGAILQGARPSLRQETGDKLPVVVPFFLTDRRVAAFD